MAQNRELGELGQLIDANTSSNTLSVNGSITVGSVTINSSAVSVSGQTINGSSLSLGSSGLSANGSFGSAGEVLHSNGTATYWATDDQGVTSVSGTSGRITSSGGATPAIDLATAGAGAASYSSGISALTVDAYGRVTSVTGSASYATTTQLASYLPLSGGTMTGALNIGTSTNLSFGNATRQMINLWSTSYGIGVQGSTEYFRSDSSFGWFRGGTHSDTFMTPGTGGTLAMQLDSSSNLIAYGSMRSPIFYDSDNTGYYFGGSSGVLNSSQSFADDWFRSYNERGLYSQSYGQHFYPDSGGYWWECDGGIRIREGYEGTVRGHLGYHDGNGFGILNSSGNWQIRMEFGNANMELYNITFANDIRPYIMYDRNDTAYYVDPNGTSVLNTTTTTILEAGGLGRSAQNSIGRNIGNVVPTWNNAQLEIRNTDGGKVGLNFHRAGYTNCSLYHEAANEIRCNGVFIGETDVRAPIFYDLNDTNWYVDPNGYSRLSGIINVGSSGNWNTDFQNTPHAAFRYVGDLNGGTNCPTGGGWWVQQNFRHSNASNFWGVQVAWGWEDRANELYTRNVSGGGYGSWIRYSNSNNGGSILVADLIASGASTIESTGCFTADYRAYEIQFQVVPGTMSAGIYMQFYVGGAWRTAAGDYRTYSAIWNAGGSQGYGPNSYIDIGCGGRIRNYAGLTGIASIVFPSRTDTMPIMTGIAGAWDSTIDGGNKINFTGLLSFNSAISGFRIYASSGTISGYVKVYGRK